jgi:hypothetical protein
MPVKVLEYIRRCAPELLDTYGAGWPKIQPVVRQEFHPDRGWTSYHMRKRITRSWVRKLRQQGVTTVALLLGTGAGGRPRVADFRLTELTAWTDS